MVERPTVLTMQNYDYTVDVAGKDGEDGESGICLKMQGMEVEGMEGKGRELPYLVWLKGKEC